MDGREQLAEAWRNFVLQEMRLFGMARTTLLVLGGLLLAYDLYLVVFHQQALSFELLALFLFTAACFALPIIGKISFGKDGPGFEPINPTNNIATLLQEMKDQSEAARRQSFVELQQQAGSVSSQLEELSSEVANLRRPPKEKAGVDVAGSKSDVTLRELRERLPAVAVPDDPQKGRFGGKSADAGRRLSATITPSPIDSRWMTVIITVESIDSRPLAGGFVFFFLHDSFEPDAYRIKVRKDRMRASLEVTSFGAFTIGAVADEGKTWLELDLSTIKSAPKWWIDQ